MENKLKKLQKIQNLQSIFILILLIGILVILYQQKNTTPEEITRTKGLVIEDEQGNPRIMMGFPIASSDDRLRTDTLNGILLLDENGADRVHLGKHGKLFLGGKYYARTNNDGWSLFFNDSKGEERSGYGFSDSDNSVGLGMDYGGEHGGEAIFLYAAPQIAFMTINADLQDNKGIRDRIVLWHETDKDLSIVKVSDSKKDGNIVLKTEKGLTTKIE